jgi:hypothetical protein
MFLQPEVADRLAQINGNTLISVGTMVSIVFAAIKITRLLGSIEARLDDLKSIPKRLASVEDHLMLIEGDINNLWALQRGGEPEQTRRERFRPNREV